MRIPILLASAAALALAGCGSGAPRNDAGQAVDIESAQWDRGSEKQLLAALEAAPNHGLTRDLFFKGELPSGDGERSRALTRIALDFASALARGKTDPTKLRKIYTVPRPKADLAAGLRQALADNKLRDWLDSLAPQTEEYRALGRAFVALVQRSPDLPDTQIPPGKIIKPGDSDPRVPGIARNLRAQGYLTDLEALSGGNRYAPELSQLVARFQADSGRKSDGIIGPDTLEALNRGPRDRARQLAVAMERLRWLEREPPATRIDVNTAATHLDYWREGQHQGQRRVVVGEPGWETPQLGSPIFQLVANPSWNVPKSIEAEELSKKPAAYFREQNIVRKNGRLVQLPGPKNALGQVKFDMKNDHAIYLHDTPAKALFALPERHESHGCVRVEGALDLARMIAVSDGVLDEFEEALASGDQTFVDLKTEIPVRLLYHTAYLGPDGAIHFAPDIYGWDNAVAEALGYEARPRPKVEHRPGDVGP